MAASSAGKRNRTPRHGSADINSVCHWLLHQAHDCLARKYTPERRRCHITRAGTAFPEIPVTVSSRMWIAQHPSPEDGMPTDVSFILKNWLFLRKRATLPSAFRG